MTILYPTDWKDYELIDSGDGQKLERFGKYILVRPDPQIIWKPTLSKAEWAKADAYFERTSQDKGNWIKKNSVPDQWVIQYNSLSFYCKLSPFKHTGLFPEQSVHWDFIHNVILGRSPSTSLRTTTPESLPADSGRTAFARMTERSDQNSPQPTILNLFGYTGAASLAAASAGAKVTHIDASYPTIGWARENQKLSGLENKPIRWILDDALKFCEREVRRNVKYDGIIMDPPAYGHGPEGEIWDFNKSLPKLLETCKQLLSPNPLFVIINAYAVSTSAITLENVLKEVVDNLKGNIESGELALKESSSGRLLSTGIFARWSSESQQKLSLS